VLVCTLEEAEAVRKAAAAAAGVRPRSWPRLSIDMDL